MAGQTCPLCHEVIAPGDGVAFQHGVLLHLDCYAARLDKATEREEDQGPAETVPDS